MCSQRVSWIVVYADDQWCIGLYRWPGITDESAETMNWSAEEISRCLDVKKKRMNIQMMVIRENTRRRRLHSIERFHFILSIRSQRQDRIDTSDAEDFSREDTWLVNTEKKIGRMSRSNSYVTSLLYPVQRPWPSPVECALLLDECTESTLIQITIKLLIFSVNRFSVANLFDTTKCFSLELSSKRQP